MKKVFSYSGELYLDIYKHKDRFYVKNVENDNLLITDNEQVARAYIDGTTYGYIKGYKAYKDLVVNV